MKRAEGLEILTTDNVKKDVNLKDWAGSNRDLAHLKRKRKFEPILPS